MNGDGSLKSNHNSRFRPGFGRTGFGRGQSYPNVFCSPQFFIAFCSMFVFKYSIIPLYIYIPFIDDDIISPTHLGITYYIYIHSYTFIPWFIPFIDDSWSPWRLLPSTAGIIRSTLLMHHGTLLAENEITGEQFAFQGRTVLMVS